MGLFASDLGLFASELGFFASDLGVFASDLGFFASNLGFPRTTEDFLGILRICQDYLSCIHSAKVH